MDRLGRQDQASIYDAEQTDVDNIRLIKTNSRWYRQVVCLFLKHRAVLQVGQEKDQGQQIIDLEAFVCAKMHIGRQTLLMKAVHYICKILIEESHHPQMYRRVQECLFHKWEQEVVKKSSSFKSNHSVPI